MKLGMAECEWPKGCAQWVCRSDGDTLCSYHRKLVLGLIDAQWQGFVTRGISRAQIISDEQVELASILADLGASPEVVQRAFTKGAQHNTAKAWQRLLYHEAAA